MTGDPAPNTSPAERAAYRAFVREHHPDRGGDPEEFVAGLARFRSGDRGPAADSAGNGGAAADRPRDRADGPVEIVASLPPPLRLALHLVRIWRRRYRPRVDRPDQGGDPLSPRRPQ